MNFLQLKLKSKKKLIVRRRPIKTVKHFFSAGVLTLIITMTGVLATVNHVSRTSSVSLQASHETAKVGERFFVDVFVDAAEPINAVHIVVEHSPNVEIESLRDGESVLNIWTEQPSVDNRQITLSGGTYRRGFSGEHRIISIQASAKDDGAATFSLKKSDAVVGDGEGTEVDLQRLNDTLSVNIRSEKLTVEDHDSVKTDLTGDGRVTLQDISIFMAAWRKQDTIYDFTGDGKMNFRDFSVLLSDFFRFR